MLKNNYFVGMRVSTLNAEQVTTEKTVFEEVIPTARSQLQGNGIDFDKLNTTSYGQNEYSDDAGRYGEGFVWYLKGDMSLDDAMEDIAKLKES